ncbi:glycosyl transferase [Marinitoga piezophila KA3]|uniref:Glycosyl transferase n=1 Tax=Marinitoga piezophila (strain DSM 14283 / JCM 11233 / KA3) TaxID=443254 RepID=H2J8F6_MARPK|nr:glycosyltransferase family 2 protein [Marinitoga piezophila]AEX85640.1 glycosyl transferase [Marinitoga piezophila KA3]
MDLSIIIPAYNLENYIENTLNSIINQNDNYLDLFEIIVVDDGSKDKTYDRALNLLSKKNNINYKIFKKQNGGVSSARNFGLKKASGKYVMFLDGDDYIATDFLEKIFKTFNYDDYDIIFWKYDIVDEKNNIVLKYDDVYTFPKNSSMLDGLNILNEILINKNLWIWTGSIIYKKDFLLQNNLKFFENCIYGEDLEFIFKSLTHAKRGFFINSVLSYYLQRKNSITKSYNIRRFDNIYAFLRTAEYMEKVNNNKFKKIIKYLKYDLLIEHFFQNYDLLYYSFLKNKESKSFFSIIKKEYNNLFDITLKIIPYYIGDKKRIKFRSFLYSKSIKLYTLLLRINFYIKKY